MKIKHANWMARLLRLTLGVCALAVLAAMILVVSHPFSATAVADIDTIAIDTDITGNTVTPCTATGDPNLDYPCNNSTVLGPIDTCRSITVGQTIQIDVVGIAIPAGGTNGSGQGAGQSDMALDWTPNGSSGPIAVTGKDFSVALIHQGDDDNATGASDAVGTTAAGESGHWRWSDVDVNADLVGEGGPGIAVRLTIKGINAGTASLSLSANNLATATWTDIGGGAYSVGTYGTALIVVGGACPTSPTPSPSPTSSPTPSPHVGKNPITDPWPKLTDAEMKAVQDLIDANKNKEALEKLVETMKKYCCNFDTMKGGKPVYQAVCPDGKKVAAQTEVRKGGVVRVCDPAFRRGANFLYSVLKHEMVHSQQWQDEAAATAQRSKGREIEAYQRNIANAANTGISDKDKKLIEAKIAEYKKMP